MSNIGRYLGWLLVVPLVAQNTPIYPGRAITINDLGVATNFPNGVTTINATVNPGDTSITVLSTTTIVTPAMLYIEYGSASIEGVFCLSKDPTHFTSCTRGLDGTSAATHSVGRSIGSVAGAFHFNQLAAEIISMQGDLFAGGAVSRGTLGLTSGNQGSLLCFDTTTHLTSTATLGLNLVLIGKATQCPVASLVSIDGSGNISTPASISAGVGSGIRGFSFWQTGTNNFPTTQISGVNGAGWGSGLSMSVQYLLALPVVRPVSTGPIGQHITCPTVDANGISVCVWATDPLTGTSGSLGGGALAAGACASGTVSITGSTTAMSVVATPVTYPGDAIYWKAYVSAAGTVTVKVCAAIAATPTSSTYNVRVIP